ncbi:MAG: Nif3-like dinuclear metal center hexameric protein [Candidatus Aquicultor primus]|uniref:GTP cyclohydrolase 1 type 2 homolog n=1 Tax=Candidatus Aquicultor primus TaxID=1797195 RepID=A0A1F2UPN4_9ACTN|nr:MAG: Nif3-like dinuclear metal center hexameric protein [Candidatus Aquicultor primus]
MGVINLAIVSQVTGIINSIAPAYLKSDQDRVGLQVGSSQASVNKVLVTLEVTEEVVKEARAKGTQLIISHHPLIFQNLERVIADDHIGGMITELLKAGISVFAAHTNLDRTRDGVSDVLARVLGLQDIQVLLQARDIPMYKIAVFVPRENVDDLISAMGNVGSGVIGEYSHCTFRTEGKGTFYPMLGAHPYLGEVSELNEVDEYRLEMLVSPDRVERVIGAMLEVHPYEEVAYDLYEVKTPPPGVGFGRVGNMLKQRSLRDYAEHWSDQLDCELRVSGDLDMMVRRVAVCGGSGGELIGVAKAAGADVFITGDIKHHAAHAAKAIGLGLVDAGHAETERLIVPELARELQRRLYEAGMNVEVVVSEIDTSPWNKD